MNGPASGVQAVLFDRDDTLSVNDPSVYLQAASWAGQRFGVDAQEVLRVMRQHWESEFGSWWDLRTLEEERAFWQRYGHNLAAELGLSKPQGEALMAQFPYHAFMRAAPGARKLLSELRRRGLGIGVLSNTLPDIWPTLEATGLAEFVDVALSSCALGIHKPQAEVFVLAAAKLGVPCQAVLFLDDRQENVDAARAVGMQAALVDLSGQVAGAVTDLNEVLALVERNWS